MSVFYDLSKTPRNILNQAIVRAIVSENSGALFDPSDMSTLYQDAAGTIPVTAVEQPVGKILDKSGNGNHATQSITASRPVLSARKNVLLATDVLATQSVTAIAAQYTLSFTGTGSVTLSGTATGTLTGTGTDRASLTFTPTAGTLTLTVSGSVTKAQVELGSTAGPYQRITTATDYDTDERYFKKYLRFDGVDDYLKLPYMGLYAAGSASVVMAKSADYQTDSPSFLAETSSVSATPTYQLLGGIIQPYGLGAYIRNDAGVTTANTKEVLTGDVQSAAHIVTITDTGSVIKRFNNSSIADSDAYTRANPLTVDRTVVGAFYAGASIYNKAIMKLYGLIITKSALTDAQRVRCERFLAQKSGVML